jgi:hypothetical protein
VQQSHLHAMQKHGASDWCKDGVTPQCVQPVNAASCDVIVKAAALWQEANRDSRPLHARLCTHDPCMQGCTHMTPACKAVHT